MYYTGTGVKQDFAEAAKWVRSAAAVGYARAELDLGFLYEQGKGVPLNHIAAYMWYKTAAAGGERRAAAQLKILSSVMTEAQIQQATAAAAELKISTPISSAARDSSSVGDSWLPPR
jgi:TPR repeat protein